MIQVSVILAAITFVLSLWHLNRLKISTRTWFECLVGTISFGSSAHIVYATLSGDITQPAKVFIVAILSFIVAVAIHISEADHGTNHLT